MKIYNIEGGINFYDELYKSLDDEEEISENENICLISNLPLVDFHFEMQCGHKFNYMPLFLDIKNHKQKFNNLEGSLSKLGHNQIRCPYCREKHLGTLPYHEELGLSKIHGVNFIDHDFKSSNPYSYNIKCEFLVPNPDFNENDNNTDHGGNDKCLKCKHYGTQLNLYGDDKYYCCSHKKLVIKIYKKDVATKLNEVKKQEKIKKTEELKKLREETKQQATLAKQQTKQQEKLAKQQEKQQKKLAKQKPMENAVMGPIVIDLTETSTEGCVAILRTGQKKGEQCGCKIEKEALCNRHYNMKHHKINNGNTVITI